jgi:hypothetical protein
MVPTKDSDIHEKDSGTHEKDSSTRGKDISANGRKGIPHIHIQPAIPYKLTFRHGSSKSIKMRDIDQEKLRVQLIEEAKQRKILGQVATDREVRIAKADSFR